MNNLDGDKEALAQGLGDDSNIFEKVDGNVSDNSISDGPNAGEDAGSKYMAIDEGMDTADESGDDNTVSHSAVWFCD